MVARDFKAKTIPKQARAKARVEKILSSTENLLITEGPEAISTTNIAQAADIPVGSIYQYFEDKDDILMQLYDAAYAKVEQTVATALESADPTKGFAETIQQILQAFWDTAKTHASFRPLTRWANSRRSLWETTPDSNSSLAALINQTLTVSGVSIPDHRKDAVLTTAVTTVSILVDLAIEEQNEDKAAAIMDELVILLTKYFN